METIIITLLLSLTTFMLNLFMARICIYEKPSELPFWLRVLVIIPPFGIIMGVIMIVLTIVSFIVESIKHILS